MLDLLCEVGTAVELGVVLCSPSGEEDFDGDGDGDTVVVLFSAVLECTVINRLTDPQAEAEADAGVETIPRTAAILETKLPSSSSPSILMSSQSRR